MYINFAVQDHGHDKAHFRGDIQIITVSDISINNRTLDANNQYPFLGSCTLSTEKNSTVYTDKNLYFNSW